MEDIKNYNNLPELDKIYPNQILKLTPYAKIPESNSKKKSKIKSIITSIIKYISDIIHLR